MTNRKLGRFAIGILVLLPPVLLVACNGAGAGLSRADVEEMVRAGLPNVPSRAITPVPDATQPEPA